MVKIKSKNKSRFPLSIHPLFILFGVYCYFTGRLITFLCYTVSALIHEFGHFLVAKNLGYKLLKVRLLPYGAELCGNLDEFLYKDEIIVAIAGPITSILLSLTIVAFWWINPNIYNFTIEMCVSSMVCGVFNFLPIFPLDGGRVLLSFLSMKMDRKTAVKYAYIVTRFFAIGLMILFVLSIFYTFNITFGILGFMLFYSSVKQNSECSYFRLISIKDKIFDKDKVLNIQYAVVNQDMPVYKIMRKIKAQSFYYFVVVDESLNEMFTIKESVFCDISTEEMKEPIKQLKSKRNFVIKQ